VACPVNTQIILLRPPIPVLLGALIALNGPVQFAPCESLTPRGQLSVSAYQSGLSAVTALLECSIDQGVSWFSIPCTAILPPRLHSRSNDRRTRLMVELLGHPQRRVGDRRVDWCAVGRY